MLPFQFPLICVAFYEEIANSSTVGIKIAYQKNAHIPKQIFCWLAA